MKLYSKKYHDNKKIDIGTENGIIKHEIELNNDDKDIIHTIPLLDKEDVMVE